nr:DegT/DnrJ/EryC1/StrS aminotransferase family protein [Oceanococcus sp. HetDA_MAG_MS8]
MLNSQVAPWPCFTQEEAAAVERVLLSNRVNYWTGTEGRDFEKEFAAWVGARYAVALANGTVALDLALKGLDIGPGDEVIVTPRTFLASVSCVVTAGATPVFADVDRDSGNLTAQTIAAVMTPKTKAVICVHLAGWPCDMDPIMALAEEHSFFVIEDCAQAHGARYKGRSVGSIGHVGAWSFCQDKIMTTGGEGGMVTTSDAELWSRMWSYKDHGKSWSAVYERQHPPGFRWLHESFGTNWRMTEMQSAIGRIQLKRMREWTRKRQVNAMAIMDVLQEFDGQGGVIRAPGQRACDGCNRAGECVIEADGSGCVHAQYKLYAYVQPHNLAQGWSRDRIVAEVCAEGVPCFQGGCSEVYLEKAFENTNWRPKSRLPVARELGETSLMFLVHPTLTESDIQKTCAVLRKVLQWAEA